MHKYLVIAVLMLFPFVSYAVTNNSNQNNNTSQQMTGKKLMEYCTDFTQRVDQSEANEEKNHAYYCLGFIGGAVESQHFISFYDAVADKNYRKDMSAKEFDELMQKYRLFCLPKDIYFRDLVPVIIDFGKKHPELLSYPAGVLLYSALRHKYPCK